MGPGQNPQYTGAPKAGGGCGLLDKSTTTSPMAQPQCSKKQCINVNKFRKQCGNASAFSFSDFFEIFVTKLGEKDMRSGSIRPEKRTRANVIFSEPVF